VALRLLRITGFAATLVYLFNLSHQASLARGNEEVPGMLWAIGVLSFLFLVRAFVSETMPDGPGLVQRDLLWGLSAGGIVTILLRNFVG
jgi:hypothetical protein